MKLKLLVFFYLAYLVWYATMILHQKYTLRFATKKMK